MVTRVLDEHGNVLHDCADTGCSVSWDGVALRDHSADEVNAGAASGSTKHGPVKKGDTVPGATGPDTELYDVRGRIAQLKAHN